jgi:hypothetical protein
VGGRPDDGQIAFKSLAVRPPMVWGLTTRLAKFAEGASMVRAMPVTTVAQARSKVAAARMMVLRMVVGPEWCGSNHAPYEHHTRPADPMAM